MESSCMEKASLHQRIERIEKQNRRLKTYIALLALSFLFLVGIGAKAGLNDGHFHQITAEGIAIVNGAGQDIILIGSDKAGTGIRILNSEGKRAVGIGIAADEGGSGILVADKEGRPRIGLGMDEGVPSIAITDDNEKKILAMGGDERGYGFVVMDGNEVERAALGFKEKDTGVIIYNDKGESVRGMIRNKDGVNYSFYVDENGKEIIER